jgi:hypothetical protein
VLHVLHLLHLLPALLDLPIYQVIPAFLSGQYRTG